MWYQVVMNPDVLDPAGDRTCDLGDLGETMRVVRDFLMGFEPPTRGMARV